MSACCGRGGTRATWATPNRKPSVTAPRPRALFRETALKKPLKFEGLLLHCRRPMTWLDRTAVMSPSSRQAFNCDHLDLHMVGRLTVPPASGCRTQGSRDEGTPLVHCIAIEEQRQTSAIHHEVDFPGPWTLNSSLTGSFKCAPVTPQGGPRTTAAISASTRSANTLSVVAVEMSVGDGRN